MKKIFFSLLVVSLAFGIDVKDVDEFGYTSLKNGIEFLDKELMGTWYLYNSNRSKHYQVENDEFEKHDAIMEAYNLLLKRIEATENSIDKTYSINLSSNFGEYDFGREIFPVSLMAPNSYIELEGSGLPVCSYSVSQIMFNNADVSKNIMPMDKDKAKTFLSSKKDKYGNVDRHLNANIEFEVKKIELANSIKDKSDCFELKIIGTIKKIDISDNKSMHIYTIENY